MITMAEKERRNKLRDRLRAKANEAGLTLVIKNDTHWQIKGGPLLVNYYPATGTYYVSGTTKGVRDHGNLDDVIAATKKPPSVVYGKLKDKRTNNNRHKRHLFHLNPTCHWCKKTPLTWEEASLEHIIPLHRGGLNNRNNMALACKECNHARGHDMPELKGGQDAIELAKQLQKKKLAPRHREGITRYGSEYATILDGEPTIQDRPNLSMVCGGDR